MIRITLAMLSLRSLWWGKVKIVPVRGHSGDPGNEGADHLACVGATRAAIDDYDWDMKRKAVEKVIQGLQSGQMAATRGEFQVLFDVCHLHPAAL